MGPGPSRPHIREHALDVGGGWVALAGRCWTEPRPLDEAINPYTNRALTEIIAELVKLAKEMPDQNDRHNRLGLSVAEAAFYDAIVQNAAAVLAMSDDVLRKIAIDLVVAVQSSATISWSLKEPVRAAMRSKVRRLLAKYDYPPDHEEEAIELMLQQAELFAGTSTAGA